MQVINDNILDKDTIGEATRHNGMYVKSKLIELLAYRSEIQPAYVGRYTGSQAWNKMVDNNEKINQDIHTLTEKISRAASRKSSRDEWTLDLVFLGICALIGFIAIVWYGADAIAYLIRNIGV